MDGSGCSSGALVVLALSALGVLIWGYAPPQIGRADAFNYFAGWIAVATSAAGVFGFTRAVAGRVTSTTPEGSATGCDRAGS